MYGYTAAHKTLPMHTIVEVINVKNNRRIKLRINDRGPFVGDRIIDLSKQVAINLDLFNSGTSEVIVRVVEISLPKKRSKYAKSKSKLKKQKYLVQIAAFYSQYSALQKKKRHEDDYEKYPVVIKTKMVDGDIVYKVCFSQFNSKEEASRFVDNEFENAYVIEDIK